MIHIEKTWWPTTLRQLFTRANDWSLTLNGGQVTVIFELKKYTDEALTRDSISIKPGLYWATVTFHSLGLVLDGISNATAKEFAKSVRVAELLRNFNQSIQPFVGWADYAHKACASQFRARGWLTFEFKAQINRTKPVDLEQILTVPEIVKHLSKQPAEVQEAVTFWQKHFEEHADRKNQEHLAKEQVESKEFFDKVEKSPLNVEQIRAVVCFDNRVLLVASAGSGKTSTIVAKAGYALKNGYFAAENMLLLSFNSAAAAELRERIKAQLEPLGLSADKITAKTFHSFGLDVIGIATGKRPSLAPWVENGRDIKALLEMVDDLKDKDVVFRGNWDLFRLVFNQDMPAFGKEEEAADAWNSKERRAGFLTLNNEIVKSRGEQVIANWLFYNGVNYVYEKPYRYDVADATHRQYCPDFFFPDADAYLEHWALNDDGEPPPAFKGYKEGMEWKKKTHAANGTTLLETTLADLWSGNAFPYLGKELHKLGVTLDPNPDRPVPGSKPINNHAFAETFRSFLTHVKNNRLTSAELHERLKTGTIGHFRYRHKMFLWLFEKIWNSWEARLYAEKCIDFEDMLNLATDCINQGTWTNPYELVMVDEFQDASQSRACLLAALVKETGKHLFAVGDDWQSINRFAGADLAVMTDFNARFDPAVTLKLETTFRCPQSLCDTSSRFVQKNPKQLSKVVRSARPNIQESLRIFRVTKESQIRSAVGMRIQAIASEVLADGKKAKVYVLGRYNSDKACMPDKYDRSKVDVEFITVHRSKGREADYIIVPFMISGTRGFPCGIVDDPMLQLAMPGADAYKSAEERRLFYVAITRARSTVSLITIRHKESSFITELVRDNGLKIFNLDGSETSGRKTVRLSKTLAFKENKATSPDHLKYIKLAFSPNVPDELFNAREIELLTIHGAWLSALKNGLISPETPEQERFIEVCNGNKQPKTEYEQVWVRFIKRKLWESENPEYVRSGKRSID